MTSLSAEFERQRKREFIASFRARKPEMFPTETMPQSKPEPKAIADYSTAEPVRLSPAALATIGIVEQPDQPASESAGS